MSSSAYQRAMSDMRQAGLNPILAYQQGGATTPIGKTAPGAGAVMQNVFGGMQGSPIASLPTLNKTFIEENPPIDRVVATPDEPDLIFDMYFDLKCARPMPLFSVPGMIDHF